VTGPRAFAVLMLALALLAACAGSPPPPGGRPGGFYLSTPDGYYRVRRGDTLYAIAFRYGLDWRDLARWNGIPAPYLIHPDQLVRLSARPAGAASAAVQPSAARPADTAAGVTTRPLAKPQAQTRAAGPAPQPAASPQSLPSAAGAASQPPAAASGPADGRAVAGFAPPAADPQQWRWPAEGRLLRRFRADDPARKGIDIAGQAGQPIRASAGGTVVYSGSGLIGYGELIIIKHSDRMLSAYAHNRRRLVGEGQSVQAGDHIADMGTNDRNEALLHFEIRADGTPVDPLAYLPRQ